VQCAFLFGYERVLKLLDFSVKSILVASTWTVAAMYAGRYQWHACHKPCIFHTNRKQTKKNVR